MVKPEKFQHLHLVYHLTVTLMSIIKTGNIFWMELIDLEKSVKIIKISNDPTHMLNFPAWIPDCESIPDCDSHSPALLDFFLPFDASICSTMAFPQ